MIYRDADFDILIRKSYGYSQYEQDNSPHWALLKRLYEKNYLGAHDYTERIPKKIHQIWFGGKLPDRFRRYVDTWPTMHPNWEYKLWTDDDIGSIPLERQDAFDSAHNLGQKSDIFRYEILRQQGGVYVDTDFECLKPLDDFLFLSFFTGIATDPDAQLYIGILGSVAKHPIVLECNYNVGTAKDPRNGNDVMDTTGPFYFTRCFFNVVAEDTPGVVAFPMDFFYPFPNAKRFTNEAYNFVTPHTYAIHHWKTSWL